MTYFTVNELCCSTSHPSLVEIPKEGSDEYNNIKNLIENLLDPVRAALGQPITVTSGYRPTALNKAVGGSKTSNHVTGCAADCHMGNNSTDNVKIIEALLSLNIPHDEYIVEYAVFGKDGSLVSCKWVHLALRPSGNRSKLLFTTDGRKYHPLKWNVRLSK